MKSSFSPAGWAIAVTMPVGDVVDVRERARLLARAEDRQRPLPGEHLADHVGDHVRDAGLVVGQLAGAVGVERPADRVGQAVLVVQRAAVDLAGELREAVGRARRRARRAGAPRWSGTRWRARTPSTRTRTTSRSTPLVERRAEDGVVEPVVHLEQRVRAACGSWRCRRRSPPGGSRACSRSTAARASSGSSRSPVWTSHASRIHAGRLALVGDAHLPAPGRSTSRRTTAAPIVPAPPVTSTRLTRPTARSRTRAEHARPARHVPGVDEQHAVAAGARAGPRTRSGWWRPPRPRRRRAPPRAAPTRPATCGSWRATCASSRSSRRTSLNESESRRSSESRLKVRPSTATLRSRSEPPSRDLSPLTRNSGTVSCTRETASSMPGRARALLGEREVLAQAGARGQARRRRSRRAGSRG